MEGLVMTTSPPSGSDAFERLHPKVQQWIWQQNWSELREAQEAAVAPILAGDRDVLIAAATASGKTEAAFLPICSVLTEQPDTGGFAAVYISPLKALINDQYGRLDQLCDHLGITVSRWHGDVAASSKSKLLDRPRGILLITPESLEAMFVLRGWKIRDLMAGARYLVIDELHSFIGTERGGQLQSLMHRLDLAARRRIPRVGLSATLGDMGKAADFLRPRAGDDVTVIVSSSDAQELRLQIRGYVQTAPILDPRARAAHEALGEEVAADDVATGDRLAIADHLFTTLRGSHHLVFAGSRAAVEDYTDLLNRRCENARVPEEFVPYHGNLSKDIREHAEARLKDRTRPATAVCTSTLEMGIDIGSVTSIAQIGAPPSVAALRQRLGRSGRRGGPATLRLYVSEPEATPAIHPADELRAQLVQSIATIELLLQRWYEPPSAEALHLSTLTQQILSLIAQHGGITPADAHRTLCGQGPFRAVDSLTFATLLRDLAAADLIRQEHDGLLLPAETGERLINHHTFYAAFAAPTEYRIVTEGRTLGSLPIDQPLPEGSLLIFAGRRWRIQAIDTHAKLIEVTRASGGRPPRFTSAGPLVHDRIRTTMRRLYEDTTVPAYLDATAQSLLAEGRDAYRRLGLRDTPLIGYGNDTLLFPFRGDAIMTTLGLALHAYGVDVIRYGVALLISDTSPQAAADLLADLAAEGVPDALNLAALIPDKRVDKYDDVIGEELLTRSYARRLDVTETQQSITALAATTDRTPAVNPATPKAAAPPRRHRIGSLPYAVVDLETTCLDARKARIAEIAIIRLHPDGSQERAYATLVNPGCSPGPTHIHGLTEGDLAAAPRFSQIAGDLAAMLDGAVIVAHNVRYDSEVLSAEFARSGYAPDNLMTLCTLNLARRFGAPLPSHRLADCAVAEGVDIRAAHHAESDARTCATLLQVYLGRAAAQGLRWFGELGATGQLPARSWCAAPVSSLARTRPLPG
ncbi:DEAD/DEAH box helicase [Nonomuraea ceibae]|uniref:DEAD/DEAH box helicase n=1 Tax=Nonomuraea ceibae TaxID=1935170 RepID=UPI001C5D39E3|nr:DEAD/DEAH box helicase [Nonomuraea ceibae]